MTNHQELRERLQAFKENLYARLSNPHAIVQISILGLLSGIISAVCIIAFRLSIESIQRQILPHGGTENYELLPVFARLLLPTASGLLIGLLFVTIARDGKYTTGIIHVMERVTYFQAKLDLRGFAMQFFGGLLAVVGGHSVGREGPGIHLGAAAASLLGQYISAPNNVLRTLVGCGSAAAIAASFNTPLAGVIFAMEVIMLEYTLTSVIPVIVAAVSGTSLTILVFGDTPVFLIPGISISSLKELPLVILLGLLAGIVSTAFIKLILLTGSRTRDWAFPVKVTLAGLLVGGIGIASPQVLSIGYDTVNSAIVGELGFALILLTLLAKLVATSLSVGLGIPGGMIGPTLFMGAMLGGALDLAQQTLFPGIGAESGLLAVIGMGAMMAATLQAPLAALTALLELTNNPGIIFPGMLAIVIAELTRSVVLHQPSAFHALLRARGLDYNANPLTHHLRRIGVFSAMNRSFITMESEVTIDECKKALKSEPRWIVIQDEKNYLLMPAIDLARYITETEPVPQVIELLGIPAARETILGIHRGASMDEAWSLMEEEQVSSLYIYDKPAPTIVRIKGILRTEDVKQAYQY